MKKKQIGQDKSMLNLRATLKLAHHLLDQNNIPHALIGGLALACYGSTRATINLDLLVREEHKNKLKDLFLEDLDWQRIKNYARLI
jgi:hypothetical protein